MTEEAQPPALNRPFDPPRQPSIGAHAVPSPTSLQAPVVSRFIMGRAVMDLVQGLEQQRLRGDTNAPSPTRNNFVARKPSADSAVSDHKSNDSVSAPSDATHDSMVTVPLSGPPSLSIDTNTASSQPPMPSSSLGRTVETIDQMPEPDVGAKEAGSQAAGKSGDNDGGTPKEEEGRTLEDELQDCERDTDAPDTREQDTPTPPSRSSEDSVNWDELQKTEHEHKERESDTVSFLTAPLIIAAGTRTTNQAPPSLHTYSWRDLIRRTRSRPVRKAPKPLHSSEKDSHGPRQWVS